MSEGELQKRINEQLNQISKLPKVMQEERFIMGKKDGFDYSLEWINEAKQDFPLSVNINELHKRINTLSVVETIKVYFWFVKWFGGE
jgi:flagellar biosynthesis/type III secretory pathway chaperone